MKVGIILGSNEASKVTYAGIHSLIETSLDNEVVLFATMDGIKAFLKQPDLKREESSSKLIVEKEDPFQYIRKAKNSGKAKIVVCSYATKLFNLNKDDYSDVVDDIEGVTSFELEIGDGKSITNW
ncbi:DsrE family protein [Acidianus sp. RZ1]|uniref:DsrE family protein n=1 Tax=Acidianus sp. RZ1 TaxID=1540082 RepID=UPI001491B0AC|nr:DsrE family protein [Acidianus sp. RZ1]NON61932.1 hypothetical protein [Acidianus sp. RZ1]